MELEVKKKSLVFILEFLDSEDLTFQQYRHHWDVHEGYDNSEAKSKVEESFGGIIAHLEEQATYHKTEEDVHVEFDQEITLELKRVFIGGSNFLKNERKYLIN